MTDGSLGGRTFGRYQILHKIGQGGMGEVFLAQDVPLDRRVALKMLPSSVQQNEMSRKRFLREAKLAASLDHPYICKVFEAGIIDDCAFIALEYVHGQTLAERMARGPLALADALRMGIEIAEAMDEAHRHEVIHRDLKPANIMVTHAGHVKVMDFGVAVRIAPAALAEADTITQSAVDLQAGTLIYMSPEQLRWLPLDPRSDLFSFGIVFHQMLTGLHPFKRSAALDTTSAILNDPLPSLTGLGEGLRTVVRTLLAKDPEARHPSAQALLVDLRRLQQETESRSPSAWIATAPSDTPSIAVLPFADLSEDQDQAHFSEGLSEELIFALNAIEGVRVCGRSSAFRFRATALDLRDVGRILDVRYLLEGSVRRAGTTLRVNVRLLDTTSGYQRWSERFDREAKDIFVLQDEIARCVAESLELQLGGSGGTAARDRRTNDLAAYNLYLKGRYHWNKRTGDGLRQAIEHFEQALVADPNYALAYAGLADAGILLAMHGNLPAISVCPRAKRAAERALELDDTLGAAHAALGFVLAAYDWDWQGAEREYRLAIELNPSDANARSLFGSACLMPQRRYDEAFAQLKRAVELDPLSPSINTGLGGLFHELREFDRAAAQLLKTIELDPTFYFAHFGLGRTYSMQGKHEAALDAFDRAAVISPTSVHVKSLRARELHLLGRTSEAKAILAEVLEQSTAAYVPAIGPVTMYFGFGDYDRAFEWLTRVLDEREIWAIWTNSSPFYAPFRSDPRFPPLVRRLGLG